MKVYVWILKNKMYMLTNLWQNILCKAQYLKLQYFWFFETNKKKKKHIRRTSKCSPCIAPGASSNCRLVWLCRHVISCRNWPVVRREVDMQSVYSPEHTSVLRVVRVRRLEAEQRHRNSWQLLCSSGVKSALVSPPCSDSVTKQNSVLRPMSTPFLLTSRLCAGQKVALYCRSLTVPPFFF